MDLRGHNSAHKPSSLSSAQKQLGRVAIQFFDNQLRPKGQDPWGPFGRQRLGTQEPGVSGSAIVASGTFSTPWASLASSHSPVGEN